MFELFITEELKVLSVYLLSLPIAVLGNILFGVALGVIKHEFSWVVFWNGLKKNVAIYVGIVLYAFLGTYLLPDLTVEMFINGEQISVSIVQAINVVLIGVIGYYIYDGIMKLSKIWKVKSKDAIIPIETELEPFVIDNPDAEG